MEKEQQKALENVWVRVILVGFLITILFVLCYFLRGTLISFFLAFTVAYILNPVVSFIEHMRWPFSRRHIQRGIGMVLLFIVVILSMAGFLTYAVPKTVSGIYQVGGIIQGRFPKYKVVIETWIEKYGNTEFVGFIKTMIRDNTEPILDQKEEMTESADTKEYFEQKPVSPPETKADKESRLKKEQLMAAAIRFKKYIPQAISILLNVSKNIFYSTFGFFGIIVNFIIFSVVSVYLLKDFNSIVQNIKALFPLSKREQAISLLSKINNNLHLFLRGQLIICLILSLIYSIGLTIAGIPLSFLIGFIAGFGNLIPYVGTGTGIILASVLALFEFHDLKHLLSVFIVFGVGQMLEGTVITPRIMGKGLGLSPVMVILSILICSQLLGFLGLLLAVPIASIVKVFMDEVISKYKSSEYYKR